MPAFVQRPAPAFTATAVVGTVFHEISLSDFHGKWYAVAPLIRQPISNTTHVQGRFVLLSDVRFGEVVANKLYLLAYFRDFTFVCPTEILAFNDALGQFKELNTEVLAVSTDSQYSHFAWANQARKAGGLGPELQLPLLADRNMKISREYGVLIEEMGIALRGLFIIDPQGILRYAFCVPISVVSYHSFRSGKSQSTTYPSAVPLRRPSVWSRPSSSQSVFLHHSLFGLTLSP